jgi:HEAT repeat protein
VNLAAIEDRQSIPTIAKVMRGQSPKPPAGTKEGEVDFPGWDRGRAAQALGLLGASGHAEEIAALLRSDLKSVRAGAALALGYLKARKHTDKVAALLRDKEDNAKACAIISLAMMGARDKSGQIASLLTARGDPSVSETACYALARLRAKGQAPALGGLLGDEFRAGDAAKALAVLGAAEHADQIAKLLGSSSSLTRHDAAIALGALRAVEHEGRVAALLKDKEDFVRHAAAVALLLMSSKRPLGYVKVSPANVLRGGNFHPLVADDVRKLRKRAEAGLRARKAKPR